MLFLELIIRGVDGVMNAFEAAFSIALRISIFVHQMVTMYIFLLQLAACLPYICLKAVFNFRQPSGDFGRWKRGVALFIRIAYLMASNMLTAAGQCISNIPIAFYTSVAMLVNVTIKLFHSHKKRTTTERAGISRPPRHLSYQEAMPAESLWWNRMLSQTWTEVGGFACGKLQRVLEHTLRTSRYALLRKVQVLSLSPGTVAPLISAVRVVSAHGDDEVALHYDMFWESDACIYLELSAFHSKIRMQVNDVRLAGK